MPARIWTIFLLCAALVATLCGPLRPQANAKDPDAIDGTWEATMTMLHGQGLSVKDYPQQVWRLVVRGNTVQMFVQGDQGQFQEVKPGGFKMRRHMSNTLVFSLDSARDGSWIETEAWLFIKTSPNALAATFGGAVKNPQDSDPTIANFFTVRTGEFRRVD